MFIMFRECISRAAAKYEKYEVEKFAQMMCFLFTRKNCKEKGAPRMARSCDSKDELMAEAFGYILPII